MVYGGALVVVVIIIYFVMSSGGGSDTNQNSGTPAPAANQAAPAPTPAPMPSGNAKAGKTPSRAAPALTGETLAKLDELYGKASGLYNEGVNLRTAGDNRGCRDKMTQANDLLVQWTATVKDQLAWQEEADMENWAQPAAYSELESRYKNFSKLQRSAQLNGASK